MSDDLDRILWEGFWQSSGRAPNEMDSMYWRGKWPELEARGRELNQPDYAKNKLLGMGAGGADVPKFGPYAQPPTPLHDVPPFPGDEAPPATVPPQAPPIATPPMRPVDLAALVDALDTLATAIRTLANSIPYLGHLTTLTTLDHLPAIMQALGTEIAALLKTAAGSRPSQNP